MRVWQEGGQLQERLLQDPEIGLYLTPSELDGVFDLDHTLKHVDEILAGFSVRGRTCPTKLYSYHLILRVPLSHL